MSNDITDLRGTIVPKSDQLNSEQLIGSDMVITVTEVRMSDSAEQPLIIHYHNDNGRPFKPSKTVRKVLILAWGHDGSQWVGRSMKLYNDPTVKFGGETVGGIRVSHMTHIAKTIQVSLTATKGKKKLWEVQPLVIDTGPALADVLAAIAAATNKATMDAAKAMASKLTVQADVDAAVKAYGDRVKALKAAAAPKTEAPTAALFVDRIASLQNMDDLAEYLDTIRDSVPPSMQDEVTEAGRARMEQLAG